MGFYVFLFINQNNDTQLCKVKVDYSEYACLNVFYFRLLEDFHNIFTYYVKYNISKILEKKPFHFKL